MSILAGLAAGAAEGTVNNMLSQYSAKQSYKRQKHLMDYQAQLSNANQKMAAGNTVEGMRMAGLNPALAQGQVQTGASVGLGNADMPQTVPFNAENILLGLQAQQIKAQTEKTQEEKKTVENVNAMNDDANEAFVKSWSKTIDLEIADLEDQLAKIDTNNPQYDRISERIASLTGQKEAFNTPGFRKTIGAVRGIEEAAKGVKANFGVVNEFLDGKYQRGIKMIQANDKELAKVVAELPRYQASKIFAEIGKIGKEIGKIDAETGMTYKQYKLVDEQIRNIAQRLEMDAVNNPNYIRKAYGVDSNEYDSWSSQDRRDRAYDFATNLISTALGTVANMAVAKGAGKAMSRGMSEQLQRMDKGIQNMQYQMWQKNVQHVPVHPFPYSY